MKRFLLALTILLSSAVLFGQDNSLLKSAQECFAAGDYSAAVTKFQEAVDKLSGRERNIAQLQLGMAKTCVEALDNAKKAEIAKDYDTAIAEYQKVLDTNPDDTGVKGLQDVARKAKQEANPTLSVSKSSLSFSSSGGTQTITVSCNMTWTLVDQTSSMCTVSRSGNELTVTCASNSSSSYRNTTFTIKTTNGVKEQKVTVFQSGKSSRRSSSSVTNLTVSPTSISVENTEGTVTVDVQTNASDYSIELLPDWCRVKNKYKDWFSLSYTANPNSSPRSNWFRVTAGGKTVKVTITQKANYSSQSNTPVTNLTVSPTSISAEKTEGTVIVGVQTNASDYSISLLPDWCRVKSKYKDSFHLSYTANPTSSPRSDWFRVTAGGKSVKVTITQKANYSSQSNSSVTNLTVSPASISLAKTEGTVIVGVQTNASDYSIEFLPHWCKVKSKYKDWFSLSYTTNPYSSPRSDWFRVTAGGKSVKVTITQKANYSSQSNSSGYNSRSTYSGTHRTSRSSNYHHKNFPDKQWGISMFLGVDGEEGEVFSYGVGAELRLKEYSSQSNFVIGADIMCSEKRSSYPSSNYAATHLVFPAYFNYSMWDGLLGNYYLSAGAQIGVSLGGQNDSTLPFALLGRLGVCSQHFDLNYYLIGYLVSPFTNGAGTPVGGVRLTYYF